MHIYVKYESGGVSLVNLNETLMLSTEGNSDSIIATNNNRIAFSTVYTGDDYKERLSDIASALNEGVVVYNTEKDIGYWKHGTSHKKSTPKSEA